MNYTISTEDQKRIDSSNERNPINIYLRNKDKVKFKVGDILIKMKRKGYGENATWVKEEVSHATNVTTKYIFIHENEFGVGYIKRIKASGKELCGDVICLAEVDWSRYYYMVDPDYIDHLMLADGQMTHGEEFKEKRKRQNKLNDLNRKLAIRHKTEQEWFDIFKDLQVGQEIWHGSSLRDAAKTKHFIARIEIETSRPWSPTKSTPPRVTLSIYRDGHLPTNTYNIWSDSMHKSDCIFLQQPHVDLL